MRYPVIGAPPVDVGAAGRQHPRRHRQRDDDERGSEAEPATSAVRDVQCDPPPMIVGGGPIRRPPRWTADDTGVPALSVQHPMELVERRERI